jgi:hypothetical protein
MKTANKGQEKAVKHKFCPLEQSHFYKRYATKKLEGKEPKD